MGAELYYHNVPYTDDPNDALLSLQAETLADYNLTEMVASYLENCQQAFNDTPEGDEYGLHATFKEELAQAKVIAAEPIPNDFPGRLRLVRRLHATSGAGIGNILDVAGIAEAPGAGWMAAKTLSASAVAERFGSAKLMAADAAKYASDANAWLNRGECVCFPLYTAPDDDRPAEWLFVGNTID